MPSAFDYIVVGAGSSGCALAARLTEQRHARVLLLEAGGQPRNFYMKVPGALLKLWFDPSITWPFATEAEPGLNGRSIPVVRGRVLGGSSAINGMVCTRGAPSDYDRWARLGLPGWGFQDVLPYFRKLENNWRGPTPYHGGSGPVTVSRYPQLSPYAELANAAAREAGFHPTDDFMGPTPEGFGIPDFSTRRGRRVSSADGYLNGAASNGNLTIATDAQALRVLVENGQAVGVEYLQHGQRITARANAEIALCAGAINSPQLLMLSGIGDASTLKSLGIAPAVDLPAVGANLEDQPAARFSLAATSPEISFNRELRFDRFAVSALRWFFLGGGVLAAPPLLASFIVRTSPEAEAPDMRLMIAAASMDARVWFPGVRKPARPVLSAAFSLCYPKSRGWVRLRSSDPLARPRIQFNLLEDAHDVSEMRRGYRLMLAMLRKPALARYAGPMVQPATEPKSDAEVDAYIRAAAATTFHPIGSCRMGTDNRAVVDGDLKVQGVAGLRVVDTSVFPTQIGGNPSLPAMMIAEKAADLMLGHSPPLAADLTWTKESRP